MIDMCAAPGSKTKQILEKMIVQLESDANQSSDSISLKRDENRVAETMAPAGVIIANDSDIKRANILVHQLHALRSPSFVVTCHDASAFPVLKVRC
jgi:multisite-specific tRNA:(cytosine-C5)-methyltransferase